jgi:putative serine protease PepD
VVNGAGQAHHHRTQRPSPAVLASVAGSAATVLVLGVGGFILFGGDETDPPDTTPKPLTLSQVSQRALPGVVKVEAEGDGAKDGAGFFIRGGDILTVDHLLAPGKPTPAVTVTLNDNRKLRATLVGRDPARDLAVLRPTGLGTPPAPLPIGDSAKITPGGGVATVGTPPGRTATSRQGTVMALNRTVGVNNDGAAPVIVRAIQLRVPVGAGDSGGPVLDSYGRVIGLLTSATPAGSPSTASSAPTTANGFALPINQSLASATHITENNGRAPKRAFLGVSLDQSFEGPGARIAAQTENAVLAGSPGDRAGLRAGDTITQVNGEAMATSRDLVALVVDCRPGTRLRIVYQRNGVANTTEAVLGTQ